MSLDALKPGKSVNGNDIVVYKTKSKSSKYIYLIAGTHGDEHEGVYILNSFVEHIIDSLDSTPPLVIIPNHNPDAVKLNKRTNSNGVDLNRNFPTNDWTKEFTEDKYYPGKKPLCEPETKFLQELFDKYPPVFIISLHSWTPFINCNGSCRLQGEILAKHIGYRIIDGDIPDHVTPGSLGTYGPEKYNAPVLTVEYPEKTGKKDLELIVEKNIQGLLEVINSIK